MSNSKPGSRRWKISTLSNLTLVSLYLIGSLVLVILVNVNIKRQALHNAERYAGLILDHNVATHAFYNNAMKTSLYELFQDHFFEPTWMSSTFVVNSVARDYGLFDVDDFYYKEAAINPRNPENEVNALERDFLERCNADPDLKSASDIRHYQGEPYFVTLRCGQKMEEDCLLCHGDQADAPPGIIDYYGSQGGFGREVGETVSVISIRMPLALAYQQANLFSLKLSALLLVILLIMFVAHYAISHRLLFAPLNAMQSKVHELAHDPAQLGKTLPLPQGRELARMVESFNQMSTNLRHYSDNQEAIIRTRTADLEKLQKRTELVLNTASEGILGLKETGQVSFINRSAQNLLGLQNTSPEGHNIFSLLVEEDPEPSHPDPRELIEGVFRRGVHVSQQEAVLVHHSGRTFPIEFSCAPLQDNGITGAVFSFNDISQRKQSEQEIQNLAFFDQLTGLPNRTLFYDRLNQAVAVARRDVQKLALMFIDLDDFKTVNDTLGHAAGDEFLKAIALRLKEGSRKADTVARLGGDEFVWFGEILDHQDAELIAEKFLEILARPVDLGQHHVESTASIGIAQYPDSAKDVTGLMKCADDAMYQVKKSSKNAFSSSDAMPQDKDA